MNLGKRPRGAVLTLLLMVLLPLAACLVALGLVFAGAFFWFLLNFAG